MNEYEKSLKLAELMGWKLHLGTDYEYWSGMAKDLGGISNYDCQSLHPYTNLAQFAAIFLKFRDVMYNPCFESYDTHKGLSYSEPIDKEPTQANILDEILAMSGVEI